MKKLLILSLCLCIGIVFAAEKPAPAKANDKAAARAAKIAAAKAARAAKAKAAKETKAKTAAEKAAEAKAAARAKAIAKLGTPYALPKLSNPHSWTMALLPDVHTYVKKMENQGILDMMLALIVRRQEEMKIQHVLIPGGVDYEGNMDKAAREELWKAFSCSMQRLDHQVPYVFSSGNYYDGKPGVGNQYGFYYRYFPTDRNSMTRRQLFETGLNSYNMKTMECAVYDFKAPHPDNRRFMIITLPFAPTDAMLEWAKHMATRKRFSNHIGIVVTSAYLQRNGQRIQNESCCKGRVGNSGEQIFQKLIQPVANLRMVVSSHICPDNKESGVGFSVAKNSAGKDVVQMVYNTRDIGEGNGGDGWFRFLEFMPDRKTVKLTTFSALLARSPDTKHMAWKNDKDNNFTFILQ